ncbi:MAG: hypothetical protein REI78_10855 [Pedobacter sp.]|nr:hypothetical protein [Pedobacter sp.]MDQ8053519.1 hypothetical protein [Pedobacter sp.]
MKRLTKVGLFFCFWAFDRAVRCIPVVTRQISKENRWFVYTSGDAASIPNAIHRQLYIATSLNGAEKVLWGFYKILNKAFQKIFSFE